MGGRGGVLLDRGGVPGSHPAVARGGDRSSRARSRVVPAPPESLHALSRGAGRERRASRLLTPAFPRQRWAAAPGSRPEISLDTIEKRSEVELPVRRAVGGKPAPGVRKLATATGRMARLSLVAGRGKVVEAVEELALVCSDELEDLGEGARGGRVFAALEVALRPPQRSSEAGGGGGGGG